MATLQSEKYQRFQAEQQQQQKKHSCLSNRQLGRDEEIFWFPLWRPCMSLPPPAMMNWDRITKHVVARNGAVSSKLASRSQTSCHFQFCLFLKVWHFCPTHVRGAARGGSWTRERLGDGVSDKNARCQCAARVCARKENSRNTFVSSVAVLRAVIHGEADGWMITGRGVENRGREGNHMVRFRKTPTDHSKPTPVTNGLF